MNSALTSLTTLYAEFHFGPGSLPGSLCWSLIILIISVSVASRRRGKWDRSFDLRMADARWFADSLTLAVADRTKSTPELVRTWTDGVPRMSTLSQQLYELSTIADRQALTSTAPARHLVDGLRQALDADVRLRTQGYAPGRTP